jgi:magnesium chelatase subunit I
MNRPQTLGELRNSPYSPEGYACRSVKQEMRQNVLATLERGEELFPGVVGFDDSVTPQIVNAVLSRHNFILLGLRGQAKSRRVVSSVPWPTSWTRKSRSSRVAR